MVATLMRIVGFECTSLKGESSIGFVEFDFNHNHSNCIRNTFFSAGVNIIYLYYY